MNKTEKRKAIRSAIASTINKELLQKKGFSSLNYLPLVIEERFENITKTKEVIALLEKLHLQKELQRTMKKSIRSGKGKMRGNKYKIKKGPLIIVSKACPLQKALKNIPGFDSCIINQLNAEVLSPGAIPGRLVIWSLPSIEKLKGLFT